MMDVGILVVANRSYRYGKPANVVPHQRYTDELAVTWGAAFFTDGSTQWQVDGPETSTSSAPSALVVSSLQRAYDAGWRLEQTVRGEVQAFRNAGPGVWPDCIENLRFVLSRPR